MTLLYNLSRNSSDETVATIVDQLNNIEGLSAKSEYISLFKTDLHITSEKDMTLNEILSLGALIGTIEANQYI